MPKSSSGRSKNGSEGRSERRRDTEDGTSKTSRSRTDSVTNPSSRRKSSKPDDDHHDGEFLPSSTSFSSTSRSPYAGVAAPSVASSYATAQTNNQTDGPSRVELQRNESMADTAESRRDSRRESRSKSEEKSERHRIVEDNNESPRNVGSDRDRRDSRRSSKSDKKEKSRGYNDHDAALPQNQFPGQEPAQYTEPYLPPVQSTAYYGDGSPDAPETSHAVGVTHPMRTTSDTYPSEPRGTRRVGEAASYFGGGGYEDQPTPSKPGKKPKLTSDKRNGQDAGTRANTTGGGAGHAAEYFSGTPMTSAADGHPGRTQSPESFVEPSRPSNQPYTSGQNTSHGYSTAAAAGFAGAAAGSYMAGYQNSHPPSYHSRPDPNFVLGQNQSAFPQMQYQYRQKRRGPLGKLANWFKDPEGVAQFEQYSEATGICKYCFDPNSSPMDAPRKHHYHGRRPSSKSRYGATGRVEKAYRYSSSSSDDERKRNSKSKTIIAGGLAALGAAKLGQTLYERKHDFDDTYSVKTGQPYSDRPANRSRVSFQEGIGTTSRGVEFSKEESKTDRRSSDKSRSHENRAAKRRSRRRSSSSSSSSNGVAKAAALGLGAAGVATGIAAASRRRSRSRSRSPSKKKGYYSKRISPKHSYVDLNDTSAGTFGFNQFWSPSQNQKRGKHAKGFFNFSNSSGSSSDADLAFGQGTVRRKDSRKFKREDGREFSMATAAALTATGIALASESDSRGKGKQSRYANVYRDDRRRRSDGKNKIQLQDHETTTDAENNDGWYDTDGEHGASSSDDGGLAYGRRASAGQSKESVIEDGGFWPWSTPSKAPKEQRGRYSGPETPSRIDPLAAATVGAGVGALTAGLMSDRPGRRAGDQSKPMREVEPVPTEDSMMSAAAKPARTSSGQYISTRDSVPLQQPQPIVPLPTVAGALANGASEERHVLGQDYENRRRRRRDSSPAKLPSRNGQVSFNIPEDKPREVGRDGSRERERQKKKDRRSTIDFSEIAKDDDKRAAREAEIEAELQRLYDEDRRRAAEKKRQKTDERRSHDGPTTAVVGAAVGAGIIAASSLSKKSADSSSDREPGSARKSSLKQSKDREESSSAESQQERIARMAAQRVSSASPTVEHENYGDYFLPRELAEHVKEHNAESATRNGDPDHPDHHVVEISPGGEKAGPFEKFNYAIFGTEPQHDPFDHPWAVPTLALVEPTPPGSRVTSRAVSPAVRSPAATPVKDKEPPADADIGEPLDRKGSKVTWGDHDTYVYEVVTPEYERPDFMADTPETVRPSTAVRSATAAAAAAAAAAALSKSKGRKPSSLSRVQTLPDDDEKGKDENDRTRVVPPVEEMTPLQREHVSKGKDFADMPGSFETSPGKSRDKTPSGEVTLDDVLGQKGVYRGGVSEPVGDLGDSSDARKDSSADVVEVTPRMSKSERRRMERAASLEDQPQYVPDSVGIEPMDSSTGVFEYLVDENGEPLPPSSALDYHADSVVSSRIGAERERVRPRHDGNFSKPKRASTFDEDHSGKRRSSKSKSEYASDPEDWERSPARNGEQRVAKSDVGISKTAAVAAGAAAASLAAIAANDEDSHAKEEKKSKRRSKRESHIFNDDDDVGSVVSSPATKADDQKARRRSKRESEIYDDDDTRSIASSPADSSSRKKSKDKKEEKRSSGIWSNIFGGAKSDVSTSSKKSSKSSKSDSKVDPDEDGDKKKKRRSKGFVVDDSASFASELARSSRRDADREDNVHGRTSRDHSIDDGFVSATEETTGTPYHDDADQSFLAERPDMPPKRPTGSPMATTEDGVSGHTVTTEREPPSETSSGEAENATQTPSSSQAPRVSLLRTSDLGSAPSIASPTAVPITFRRPPGSPATPRAFFSSPIASPQSPLATPRTRQGRPKSTEFRSNEFRPLFLVQKSRSEKAPIPEVEENLPSLPSSRASSAHPSLEDLRGTAERQDYFDLAEDASREHDRARRHSYSWWDDETTKRRQSPDYLDSRAATPVPLSVQRNREQQQRERGRERPDKPKPKYEFHSPSELLQDPAMLAEMTEAAVPEDLPRVGSPLPSVASTDEFMSAVEGSPSERSLSRSRSRSRPRSRRDTITATGLGIGLGAAAALGATELLSRRDQDAGDARQVSESDDMYGDGRHTTSTESIEVAVAQSVDHAGGDQAQHESGQDAPVDVSATPTEQDEWAFPVSKKQSKKDKRKSKAKADVHKADPSPSSELWTSETAPLATEAPVEAAESWQSSTTTKKSKMGTKGKNGALPALDIAKAEARSEDGQRAIPLDDDEPLTAVPSLPSDGQRSADVDAADGLALSQHSPNNADDLTPAHSDDPTTLNEYCDRDAFPFESQPFHGSTGAEQVGPESTTAFVPHAEDINKPSNELGAFEEAFERAVRARGLSESSSREDALVAFLPKRDNAPFTAQDTLQPVGEERLSTDSTSDIATEDTKTDGWGFAVKKNSKKEKRKSKLRESLGGDIVGVPGSNDLPSNQSKSLPEELQPAVGVQESPATKELAPEDDKLSWAPTSKKDQKKKKRQSQTFDLSEPTTSTDDAHPGEAREFLEDVVEQPQTALETEWDVPSGNKGKKSKKDKKRSSDWTDDVVPVAAAAAALGAGATFAALSLGDEKDTMSEDPSHRLSSKELGKEESQDVKAPSDDRAAEIPSIKTPDDEIDTNLYALSPTGTKAKDKEKHKSSPDAILVELTAAGDVAPQATADVAEFDTPTDNKDIEITEPTAVSEDARDDGIASEPLFDSDPSKEAGGDDWGVPVKKSKKEKRKDKKRSSVFADTPTEPLPISDPAAAITSDLKADDAALEQSTTADEVAAQEAVTNESHLPESPTKNEGFSAADVTPRMSEAIPADEPEDFAWAPTKKSKKDKKKAKQRASLGFGDDEESLPTASSEPASTPAPEASAPADEADKAETAASERFDSISATPVETPAEEAEGFAWAPTKKSKKDKKKRKSVVFADNDDTAIAQPTSDNREVDTLGENQTPLIDEAATEEQNQLAPSQDEIYARALSEGQAEIEKQGNDVDGAPLPMEEIRSVEAQMVDTANEDPRQVESEDAESFSWATPAKKKKDKKKKRGSIADLDDLGEEVIAPSEVPTVEEAPSSDNTADSTVDKTKPIIDPVALSDGIVARAVQSEELDKVVPATSEAAPSESEPAAEAQAEKTEDSSEPATESNVPEDDEWAFASKKKDKKKKRASTLDFEEAKETSAAPVTRDAPEMVEDEDWDLGLSSKERKKRRKELELAGNWPPLKPRELPGEEIDPNRQISASDVSGVKSEGQEQSVAKGASSEAEMVQDLDWDLNLSSKERKRKKKDLESAGKWPPMKPKSVDNMTALDPAVEASPEISTEMTSNKGLTEETTSADAIDLEPSAADHDWGVPVKSKKEKKKKRASALVFDEPDSEPATALPEPEKTAPEEPSALVTEMATAQPVQEILEARGEFDLPTDHIPVDLEHGTETKSADDDEWAVPTKKSNKDKKQAKEPTPFDTLEDPVRRSHFTDSAASEVEAAPRDVDTIHVASAEATVTSPAMEQDRPQEPVPSFPESSRDAEVIDDLWATPSSTKKSKKDKKKKRTSTFEFDESAEAGPQETDPLKVSQDDVLEASTIEDGRLKEDALDVHPAGTDDGSTVPVVTESKEDKQKITDASMLDLDKSSELVSRDLGSIIPEDSGGASVEPIVEATPLAEAETPAPEENWVFTPGKKSKKDKKKKQSSTLDFDEPSTVPMVDDSAAVPKDASTVEESSIKPDEVVSPTQEAETRAGDAQWGFSTGKKSKKDKKKKRASTFDLDEPSEAVTAELEVAGEDPSEVQKDAVIDPAPAPNADVVPVEVPTDDNAIRDLPAEADATEAKTSAEDGAVPEASTPQPSQAAPEDDWTFPVSTKTSKKDKKKKRQGLSFDDFADPSPAEEASIAPPEVVAPDVLADRPEGVPAESIVPAEAVEESPPALTTDVSNVEIAQQSKDLGVGEDPHAIPREIQDGNLAEEMAVDQPISAPELVEDVDWDVGLSSKERKKKEKQLRNSGQWPPMKTVNRTVESDLSEQPPALDNEDVVAVQPEVDMVPDNDWDLGLTTKERKRKEKQLRAEGHWPPMKAMERSIGAEPALEPETAGERLPEPVVPLKGDPEVTKEDEHVSGADDTAAEMVEDPDWDLGLSSKERKKREKQLRADGNWPPMKLAEIAPASLAASATMQTKSLDLEEDKVDDSGEWAFPDKQDKKSKKKKKRGLAFDWSDDTPGSGAQSGDVTPAPEAENHVVEDTTVGAAVLAAGAAAAAVASVADYEDEPRGNCDLDFTELESAAAEPGDWSVSAKKSGSKKEKKKRRSIPGAFEESGSTTPATPQELQPVAVTTVETKPDEPRHTRELSLDEALDDVLLMDSLQRDETADTKDRWAFEDDFMSGEPSRFGEQNVAEVFAEPESVTPYGEDGQDAIAERVEEPGNAGGVKNEDTTQPQPQPAAEEPPAEEPPAEEPPAEEPPAEEPPAEDDWGFATTSKKSKKDKKNKRQSNVQQDEEADLSTSVTPARAVSPPAEVGDVYDPPRSTEVDPLKIEDAKPHNKPDVEEGEEWSASASKQSKKDKKKKKRQSTFDEFEPEREAAPGEETIIAPVEITGDNAYNEHQQERDRDGFSPIVGAAATGAAMAAVISESPAETTAREEDYAWASASTKKSKKDKKKNREAELYEPLSERNDSTELRERDAVDSVQQDRDISPVDPSQDPVHQQEPAGEDDSFAEQPKKSKKDKKKNRQAEFYEPAADPMTLDEPSALPTDTAQEGVSEQRQPRDVLMEEEPTPEADPDDVWGFKPQKKSKKGKKKRDSTFEDTAEGEGDQSNEFGREASRQNTDPTEIAAPKVIPYSLTRESDVPFVPTPPPAVADESDRAHDAEADVLRDYEDDAPRPGIARRDTNQEVDDWYTSTSKSKSKKGSKKAGKDFDDGFGLKRADTVDTIASMYGGEENVQHDRRGDRSMPVVEEKEEEDAPLQALGGRKKSKKDKKLKGKTPIVWEEEESVAPVAPMTTETVDDERYALSPLSKKGKRPASTEYDEHPRGPSPVQAWSAAGAPTQPRDVGMHDSDGSEVSESTRERRRRRRSPQAWSAGEEPPDLPRDRALTPPPERNDVLDTALGVAAAMGFGGDDDAGKKRSQAQPHRDRSNDDSGWSFANVKPSRTDLHGEVNRDSGVQFESPVVGTAEQSVRDSGYGHGWDHEGHQADTLRPIRPQSPTSSSEDIRRRHPSGDDFTTPAKQQHHAPNPIEPTSKDRSSVVFQSSPAAPGSTPRATRIDTAVGKAQSPEDLDRSSPSLSGQRRSRDELLRRHSGGHGGKDSPLASNLIDRAASSGVDRAVFSPPPTSSSHPLSPPKSPLHSIPEDGYHNHPGDITKAAAIAGVGALGAAAILGARDSASSPKSLGRSKSRTSSLRNLRGTASSPLDHDEAGPSTLSRDVTNERNLGNIGQAAAPNWDMADYDGYGHNPGSPRSPTRPPSITKRRSMQQIQDLQLRIDQLAGENRNLAEAKITAERHLEEFHLDQHKAEYATQEALKTAEAQVRERDEEIANLQREIAAMAELHQQERGGIVGDDESTSRELETLRAQHHELSQEMDSIIRHQIDAEMRQKNADIERLQRDLSAAKEEIRGLQSQILAQGARGGSGGAADEDIVDVKDEDYFDNACQQLCQHVQQWVLRFSKHSDNRVCRSTNEVRDEKIVDRFDNAILDGSDVDVYLGDRVKRRDVFMSVVMTMIWEYVFTRYLFGMDRDQRQKLKQLEKNLAEVGPASSVNRWRAITLTMLSKRSQFKGQCDNDTEAVALEVFGTLSKFLPPPRDVEPQILDSLRGVMRKAVELSVEMRCQKQEYVMLPPLQPEYDVNGDLAQKVYFNAALMNERSGETRDNEELEREGAVVRIVLFPLVVSKTLVRDDDDQVEKEEEVVVCPAQVLVAREGRRSKSRQSAGARSTATATTAGRVMSMDAKSNGSLAMSGVEATGPGGDGGMI